MDPSLSAVVSTCKLRVGEGATFRIYTVGDNIVHIEVGESLIFSHAEDGIRTTLRDDALRILGRRSEDKDGSGNTKGPGFYYKVR